MNQPVVLKHTATVETLIHMTCSCCENTWSLSVPDHYRPSQQTCPYCSEPNEVKYYNNTLAVNIVRDTGTVKGRGVYAGRDYKENEVVEVSPVIVFESEYEDLPMPIHRVIYDWEQETDNETTCAIALGHGSLFNHASSANLRFDLQYAKQQIVYTAACDISSGTELTINYNSENGEPEWHNNQWFDEMKITPI